MSCDACREIEALEGEAPRCEGPEGCLVPPAGALGARVLMMREVLVRTHALGIGSAVLECFGATGRELRLLAALEDEIGRLDSDDSDSREDDDARRGRSR